jgi:hypothetical protein
MAAQPDLTEFVKLSKPKASACQVSLALDSLDGEMRAQLEAALATDRSIITDGAISAWLAARNLKASFSAVTHHRRQTCRCERG